MDTVHPRFSSPCAKNKGLLSFWSYFVTRLSREGKHVIKNASLWMCESVLLHLFLRCQMLTEASISGCSLPRLTENTPGRSWAMWTCGSESLQLAHLFGETRKWVANIVTWQASFLLSWMKTETVCTEWSSHAIQKYEFLQSHKKHVLAHSLKKCATFFSVMLHENI